ncbi:glycosyltransferase [Acidimangrovimonas pyrenivorans]|uniref:Glycosyltransferase n=1 Tax=Acidimangrovimonas pyrenivorans TaxID=2030798 RepID=A0ABV7AJG2_9RHOB
MPSDPARPLLKPLLSRKQAWIYRGFAFGWLLAALYFWTWWFAPGHVIAPWLFIMATAPLVWAYLLQLYFLWVLLGARVTAAPAPQPGRFRVAMITTKTPAEPFEVVRPTLEAMLAQDYPHDTWLADEDPTPEVLAWCAAHGVRVSTRRGRDDYHRTEWPRRTRCKEGNLAFFYDHWGYADYDIVSQLDADHVPQPGYLREMVRPFADPAVGYVSAPSICAANAGESWAARTRLYVEAAFHGAFQTGYTGVLAPMCIGSHYAVRTRALKAVGGLGPELAEDHSTTMLMNAGGWRGVHAIDAIAIGDGPASVSDLATQEFQWSRSLVSLLLNHTQHYLGSLKPRLKFLFVFCQLWYALFALTTALMYFLPMVAVLLNRRFADVTYPVFLGHAVPTVVVMTLFAYRIRADGFMRPRNAPVIAWEKGLFLLLQWPWVLWGVAAAVRDRISGDFIDFRITPKGASAGKELPGRILAVYALLALGCLVTVVAVSDVTEARGFYLLTLLNGLGYTVLVSVIVVHHWRENGLDWSRNARSAVLQLTTVAGLLALVVGGVVLRGSEGLYALAIGLEPFHIVRLEYAVSGAGSAGRGHLVFLFDPGWN